MLKLTIKKIAGLILVLTITSYTITGFCHIYKKLDTSIISKKIIDNPYFTIFVFKNVIDRILPAKKVTAGTEKNAPLPKKNTNKKVPGILFLANTLLISNNGTFLLFTIFMISLACIKKTRENIRFSSLRQSHGIMSYKNRILKFITPMQKCLNSRADEYDINPLVRSLREILIRILNLSSLKCGFFYGSIKNAK